MPHILITPTGAQRPNGDKVFELAGDLPSSVCRDLLDALARSLVNMGYRVEDTRPYKKDNPYLCARCHLEPPATSRAKYCPQCQVEIRQEGKRRFWAGVKA